jgi:RNA polymerase sigma-54 factor
MLNQRLQQKMLQKLSPQQIQMIKLLEIPTIELEQRIKKELEENPILEEGEDDLQEPLQAEDSDAGPDDEDSSLDAENTENPSDIDHEETERKDGEAEEKREQNEFELEDFISDDDYEVPDYKLSTNNYSKDDKYEDIPFSVGNTFLESLESQLGLRTLDEQQQNLARYLLGNIDEDGYVRRKLDNIVDDLAFVNIKANEEELLDVLRIIQELDPAGVGARDLQECLLLQIERKDMTQPEILYARKILKFHFEEFTRKHYDKIIQRLNLSNDEMKQAVDEILKLNPKPGQTYSDPHDKSTEHVVPDFILEMRDDELHLSLNSKNVPELRISRDYTDLLNSYKHKNQRTRQEREAVTFMKQKTESARWFIDALKQRQATLLLTMQAIIKYQHNYFIEGDETQLRPMILKDIAEKTGLDISTISRVANSKYIQTHFGVYPLKFFFSEGMQNDSGEEVSTREIKKILQDCIAAEDKSKPVTDDELAAILKEKGYPIARRTIAKYREQLDIPVARLRKEL